MMMLAGFMMLAVPALSEEKQADNTQIIIKKMRADKKLLIAEAMKLTESEAKAFWPLYEGYQKALGAMGNRMLKLIDSYAAKYETMSNKDARGLLDEYMAIARDRLKLQESYLPKFRNALPEIKVFRYYQLENKVETMIYALLAEQIPVIK
jgi:hypothetical protein